MSHSPAGDEALSVAGNGDNGGNGVVHDIQDVSVEAHGVQLFVSNQAGHAYHLRNVTAGEQSWQCSGTWADETIQRVAEAIQTTGGARVGPSGAGAGASDQQTATASGFDRPGRPLGGSSGARSG